MQALMLIPIDRISNEEDLRKLKYNAWKILFISFFYFRYFSLWYQNFMFMNSFVLGKGCVLLVVINVWKKNLDSKD